MPEAAPSNGAPASNGAAPKAATTPAAPAPSKDTATGPQTSSGPGRGPDGKFTSGTTAPPAPVHDEDPEVDLGDRKLRRSALNSELARARQASKLLAEADKRARAAEEREKSWAERESKAKEDIGHLLDGLGLSAEQEKALLAKRLYSRHIEPEQMTEEQRKLREYEQKLSAYEADKKAREDADKKAADDKAHAEASAALEAEILQAANAGKLPGAEPNAPGRAAVIRKVAAKMAMYEGRNLNVPLEQVVSVVREETGRETGAFVASASVDELRELWGPEAFNKHAREVTNWVLAKLKSKANPAGPVSKPRAAPAPQTPERMTPQQFQEWASRRK